MSCPLYTKMRPESTTLYVLPSANEDFTSGEVLGSAKVRFSKFALVKLPNWDNILNVLNRIPADNPKFDKPLAKTYASNIKDGLPDLLRSYVANHEVNLRSTIDSDGKYIYDPNALYTVSEKIVLKFLQRLEILQLEIAEKNRDSVNWDEVPQLANPNFPFGTNPPDHWNQQLWKERDTSPVTVNEIRLVTADVNPNDLNYNLVPKGQPGEMIFDSTLYYFFDIEFNNQTRYKPGDQILVRGVDGLVYKSPVNENGIFWVMDTFSNDPIDPLTQLRPYKYWVRVALEKDAVEDTQSVTIVAPSPLPGVYASSEAYLLALIAQANTLITPYKYMILDKDPLYPRIETGLKYERVIKYVGNVDISTSVKEANRSTNIIMATVSESAGQSPLVLFKTRCDWNYKPLQNWPNESQVQEEILGAELSQSLINKEPSLFPGDKWALFDALENQAGFAGKYLSSEGDKLRRWGDYYGNTVPLGRQTDPEFSENWEYYPSEKVDGLGINFDLTEYIANGTGPYDKDWETFNSNQIGNYTPKSFEFNTVFWYYDVTQVIDGVSKTSTNLYGIEFLQEPTDSQSLVSFKKIAGQGTIEGNGVFLQLGRTVNLNSDTTQLPVSDLAIDEGFSNALYETVWEQLYKTTTLFETLITDVTKANTDYLKGQSQWMMASNQLNRITVSQQNIVKELSRLKTLNTASSNTVKMVSDGEFLIPENITPHWAVSQEIKTSAFGASKRLKVFLPEGLTSVFTIINESSSWDKFTLDIDTIKIGQSIEIILKSAITLTSPVSITIESGGSKIGEWIIPGYNTNNSALYTEYQELVHNDYSSPFTLNTSSKLLTLGIGPTPINFNYNWAKTGDWVYFTQCFYKSSNLILNWKGVGQITQLNTGIVKVISDLPIGTTTLVSNPQTAIKMVVGLSKRVLKIVKGISSGTPNWQIDERIY